MHEWLKNKKYVVNKLSRKTKRKLLMLLILLFLLKLGSYRKIIKKEARYKNKKKDGRTNVKG